MTRAANERLGGARTSEARGGRRALGLLAALVVVWCLLMRQFGGTDVYSVMGPFALVVGFVVRLLRGRALRAWFRPTARAILVGLGVGAAMTALTYPAFTLATRLFPRLLPEVQSLYADADSQTLAGAVAWVCVLVVAEELLWRGALLEALEHRTSHTLALILSVLSYAVAQLGSGSWIVFLLAVVCGTIWTVQRRLTDSLLSSTIAHLIWTQTVILLYPVT